MRNVTGDPRAGVLEGELFDITPYAGAYVRYFVRHPTTQSMPRKVKTAFAATDEDNAITQIHDMAFIPRIRDGVRGVEMRVGGGTSIMPRIAPTLYEFVELDNGDYLKVTEAVHADLRPPGLPARQPCPGADQGADRQDRDRRVPRAGRGGARGRLGLGARLLAATRSCSTTTSRPTRRPRNLRTPTPTATAGRLTASCRPTSQPQRQPGFSTVEVKVRRGDLTVEQLRGLADVMRRYSGGYARTTVHQNLVLRWVRDESVYEVWRALSDLELGDAGADEISDVVSCPGTDSCKLGITSSMGLNQAIQERIVQMEIGDPLTRRIHIKMSGCPNGCGQHHIADIGFYGASIKVGDRTIPAYIPHVGGVYEGGEVRYGQRLKARLPAKRVPEAVERWVRFYESERADGEPFREFVDRVGAQEFEQQVKDLTMPIEFNLENMNHFIDCNRESAVRGPARRGRVRGLMCGHRPRPGAGDGAGGPGLRRRALPPRLTMACSFQKEESVLLHMLTEITPEARAFTIDTGVLFPETLATWKAFEERFGVKLEVLDATSPGEPWTAEHCCSAAKVQALELALVRRRRLDHRHPPRAGADARWRRRKFERDEQRRDLEAQPARRLEREGPLALHLRARSALPSAARSGLRLDRLCAVHAAGRGARRSVGRSGQDRVRHPRLA